MHTCFYTYTYLCVCIFSWIVVGIISFRKKDLGIKTTLYSYPVFYLFLAHCHFILLIFLASLILFLIMSALLYVHSNVIFISITVLSFPSSLISDLSIWFLLFFSLCVSVWILPAGLSSSLLMFSSAVTDILLIL